MEKREKTLNIIKICAHAVPSALFGLMVLALIIGAFVLDGKGDAVVAVFLYSYMPLSIIGGALGIVLDIRKILKKEGIPKNILLILLSVINILLGIWLLDLHNAFSV